MIQRAITTVSAGMNDYCAPWVALDSLAIPSVVRGRQLAAVRLLKDQVAIKSDLVTAVSAEAFSKALCDIAINGDRSAFAGLFSHFAPRIKTYLIRLGAARSQAEDIAQETMLTVWRKAALYDPAKASPAAWIFTIARNLRIDALRKERHPSLLEQQAEIEQVFEPTADVLIDRAQQGQLLLAALSTLPKEQGDVVQLAYFSDKSHSEIEQELGIPLGTVKSRLRLATARLKALMDEYR